MINKISFLVVLVFWLGGAHALTYLTLDQENKAQLPKRFRTTATVLEQSLNRKGIHQLNAIASGQFAFQSLALVLKKIPSEKIILIDLRAESHGFLNGQAVSWYGPQNADNAHLSSQKIEKVQQKLLQALAEQSTVNVYSILAKDDNGTVSEVKRMMLPVQQVISEMNLAARYHLGYERFYVQDFHAPGATEVDRFINLIRQKPSDVWLYFHCRGGSGRTTLFMVMLDMMQNAKQVTFAEILARQRALGGKDLSKLPPKSSFKYLPAIERFDFLKAFYDYAKQNQNNFKTLWSDWLKNRNMDLAESENNQRLN